MKKKTRKAIHSNDYLGCFGNFKIDDTICRIHCVLSLKCAIEKEQNIRIELLDELFSYEGMSEKIQ